MSQIDWDAVRPQKRLPTRREMALYNRWVKYLADSKLTQDEVHRRAVTFTERGEKPST